MMVDDGDDGGDDGDDDDDDDDDDDEKKVPATRLQTDFGRFFRRKSRSSNPIQTHPCTLRVRGDYSIKWSNSHQHAFFGVFPPFPRNKDGA